MKPVDYEAMTEKTCSKCNEVKPVSEFSKRKDPNAALTGWRYNSRCKPCVLEDTREFRRKNREHRNAQAREWRQQNKDRAAALDRRKKRKYKYGISEDEYEHLRAVHDRKCWLCRTNIAKDLDHDHQTGKIRGVLCGRCNLFVMAIVDSSPEYLDRLIEYKRTSDAYALLGLANKETP